MSLVVRHHDEHLLPAMREYGLGLLPYFPLASGLLTGKYKRNTPMPAEARLTKTARLADRYLTERNWAIAEKLDDFATARGHTILELAFSWLLSRPARRQRHRRRYQARTDRRQHRRGRLAPQRLRTDRDRRHYNDSRSAQMNLR